MQRWLWWILISGWAWAGLSAARAADERRWQLVADIIPPYQNDLAADQGVLSQLVLAALQQQQVPAEVVLESWPSVKKHASEPHHASFFWLRDLELEKNWLFSEPLFKLTTYLVTRAELTQTFSRPDELRPYRLAVTEWASYGDRFDRIKPELKLRLQLSDHQSMQALLKGEVDIALMDPVIAHLLLSQLDVAARQKVRLQPMTSLTAQDVYLVCSRNYLPCFEFMQKFNKGWQHLRATGVLEQSLGPVVHYPE